MDIDRVASKCLGSQVQVSLSDFLREQTDFSLSYHHLVLHCGRKLVDPMFFLLFVWLGDALSTTEAESFVCAYMVQLFIQLVYVPAPGGGTTVTRNST